MSRTAWEAEELDGSIVYHWSEPATSLAASTSHHTRPWVFIVTLSLLLLGLGLYLYAKALRCQE